MSEKTANQIWTVLLALVVALSASLLLQAGLFQVTAGMLARLVPSMGTEPAVFTTAFVSCLLALSFVTALAVLLGQTMQEDSDWRWLARAAGLTGLAVLAVSLANRSALNGAAWAQLAVVLAWSLLAFWLSRGAPPLEVRMPTPWIVPTGERSELLWMTQHLLLLALGAGLVAFSLGLSNFLMLMARIHPDKTPDVYLHGFKLGILLALLLTPATRYVRTPLVVGFLVDWLGGLWLPAFAVPLFQFGSVVTATLLTQNPFQTAWKLSAGMCAGRILGRALGFLLVGAEGVALMEPLAEVTLGVLATEPE